MNEGLGSLPAHCGSPSGTRLSHYYGSTSSSAGHVGKDLTAHLLQFPVLRSAFLFSSLSPDPYTLSISYYLSGHSTTLVDSSTSPHFRICTESRRLFLLAVGQPSGRNWPIRSFLHFRPALQVVSSCGQTFLTGIDTR